MQNIQNLTTLAQTLVDQFAKYSEKPTKAESKRIRATVNEMQKLAVAAKRDMIAADEAGS